MGKIIFRKWKNGTEQRFLYRNYSKGLRITTRVDSREWNNFVNLETEY